MGANAQTKVPTFAPAEVLTAANTNLLSNGIPVFSGTATRDSSFGGSGEKTLAEGQFAYLEDSNTTQYYDGSVWQSVGVTPGLVLITSGTLSGAAAKNVDSVFTATYSNYLLVINNASATTAGAFLMELGMRTGGSTNTTSNYKWASITNSYTSSVTGGADAADNAFGIGGIAGADSAASFVVQIGSPQLTALTTFHSAYNYSSNAGIYMGYFNATTSFDGFSIFVSGAGNLDDGTYKLYGYSNS
jgi:hypothetical protein